MTTFTYLVQLHSPGCTRPPCSCPFVPYEVPKTVMAVTTSTWYSRSISTTTYMSEFVETTITDTETRTHTIACQESFGGALLGGDSTAYLIVFALVLILACGGLLLKKRRKSDDDLGEVETEIVHMGLRGGPSIGEVKDVLEPGLALPEPSSELKSRSLSRLRARSENLREIERLQSLAIKEFEKEIEALVRRHRRLTKPYERLRKKHGKLKEQLRDLKQKAADKFAETERAGREVDEAKEKIRKSLDEIEKKGMQRDKVAEEMENTYEKIEEMEKEIHDQRGPRRRHGGQGDGAVSPKEWNSGKPIEK